jgi:aminoacrylate hydrolase
MTIELSGITLGYLDQGQPSSRRPVMLLTGLGGVGTAWGPQIELFGAEGRIIVPDHRGTGRSTHTLTGLDLPQLAEDMAGLVKALHLGPVHVVGSSTGGAIGQLMALDHADTVASLSLVASWGRVDNYFETWFGLRSRVLEHLSFDEHIALTQLLLHSPAYWTKNQDAFAAQRKMMAAQPPENDIALARIRMILDHDVLDRLPSLDVPTLVVAGGLDVVCPPYLSEQLTAAIPGARYELMAHCGHYVHTEDPAGVHQRVAAFIDAVEGAQ